MTDVDWSMLPSSLCYVTEAADKYGIYTFEDQIVKKVSSIGSAQKQVLVALKDKIEAQGDRRALADWIESNEDRYPMQAERLNYLLLVLDFAEAMHKDRQ